MAKLLQSQKYVLVKMHAMNVFESCELCAVKCLYDENVKLLAKCVEICVTCSHACAAASLVISGESEYAKKFLGLVAEICEACAAECEKHQHMEHCRLNRILS